MSFKRLKDWQKESGTDDALCMKILGLTTIEQFRNRMIGRTKFTKLERITLAGFAGIDENELFKEE